MIRYEHDKTGWDGGSGRSVRVIVHEDGPLAHAKAVEAMLDGGGSALAYPRNFCPTDPSWTGRRINTWAEMTKAVVDVWPDGVRTITELAAAVRGSELPTPKSVRRRVKYREDEGDEFNLDRYEDGMPPWRAMSPRRSVGPQVVSLACQIGGRCGVSSTDLFWRGAVSLVLCELLEDAGYLVELVTYSYPESHGREFGTDGSVLQAVVVKRPDDILDRGLLASACAPWYFRALMFAGYWLWPHGETTGCGGQGTMPRHLLKHLTATAGAVVIENVWDRDAAVGRVRSALAELGREGSVQCQRT
jgi:hypothetical protein